MQNDIAKLWETSGLFAKDPLRWVMWAFPWDADSSIQKVKLVEPWASMFPSQIYGPESWFCEMCDEWRAHILETNFNGSQPVAPFRFAASSGHGVGKSAGTSMQILFIASTRKECRGVVTANTSDQLKSKTWVELAKWKALCATGDQFDLTSGRGNMRLYHKEFPETWRVDALTSREENSEAFAGLHNANSTPFFIFDEASSIPDKIWEVSEGGLTDGEPFHFVYGNPTRNTGKFRECFRKNAKRWVHMRIDSRDCQITNKTLIGEWVDDYGEDSDFVKVRVRGDFPSQSVRQFIPEDLVLEAQKRGLPKQAYQHAPVVVTCDPSWSGDDATVIAMRQGLHFEILHTQPKNTDDVALANMLMRFETKYAAAAVFIDAGYGTGIKSVGDSMGRHWHLVWFGGKPADKGYLNKRAEMWGGIISWLGDGGCLPEDNDLFMDLIGPETVPRSDGRIQLEAKEQMKRRGLASPNKGDALALSFALPVLHRNAQGNRSRITKKRKVY